MTSREEILNKIKLYEAKWGKLGTGRIMDGNDNLIHSAERSTDMSKSYDNSYYEYRRKVLEGKEKNKLAHMKTFSPREMNQQFYDDMISSGRLVHAATMHDGIKPVEIPSEYLEHKAMPVRRDNSKYYQVIVLPNGKSRYFYTKAEWDAYNKSGEPSAYQKAQSGREAAIKNSGSLVNKEKKKVLPEVSVDKDGRKFTNYVGMDDDAITNHMKNDDAATVKKYGEIARKSPEAAAKEIVKTRDFGLDEFMYDVEEGFKNGSLSLDEDGRINGDTEDIEYYTNNIQKWCKWVGEESGSGAKVRDAVGEMISDEIEALWKKYGKAKHSAFSFEDDDVLEHAIYGPASGTNQYVAKIDDFYGKGKPRYFYSREEWDAYQKNRKAAQQSGADRAEKERVNADKRTALEKAQGGQYKAESKARTDEQARRIAEEEKKNKADAYNKIKDDLIRKNEEYAKNAGADRGSKESSALQKAQTGKEAAMKNSSSLVREKWRDNWDEFEKAIDNELYDEYHTKYSKLNKAQQKRFDNEIEKEMSDVKTPGDLKKKFKNPEDYLKAWNKIYDKVVNEYKQNEEYAKNAGADKANKQEWNEASKKTGLEYKEGENIEYDNEKKAWDRTHKNSNSAKHSSIHEEELMDEYKSFMARAKAGKEKNTLAHSKFISPAELNRKYHEDYADECVLIHKAQYGPASGTNKYYAKIDDFWGKGKPRYFYSKAEWDGYQNNKKASQQSGADRASKEKSNAEKNARTLEKKNKEASNFDGDKYQKYLKEQKAKKILSSKEDAIKKGTESLKKEYKKDADIKENFEMSQENHDKSSSIAKENTQISSDLEKMKKTNNDIRKEIRDGFYEKNPDEKSFADKFNETVEERGGTSYVMIYPDLETHVYNQGLTEQIKKEKEERQKIQEDRRYWINEASKAKSEGNRLKESQAQASLSYADLRLAKLDNRLGKLETELEEWSQKEFYDVCKQMGINLDEVNLKYNLGLHGVKH